MKSVGVSGLTGMIGKNLISRYAQDLQIRRSLKLIAFTRRQSDTNFLDQSGIEHRRIDYTDRDSFAGKLEDIDAFLHLAGLTKAVTPAGYYRVNVDGTARLLEALSLYGKTIRHFIFISSTAATGPTASTDRPKTEEDPCNPVSHYGRSKLRAEELVRSCPFDWTVVRLPAVFGPHDFDMLTMFRFAKSGRVTLFSDPRDPYSYASAPDVGRFLLDAMFEKRLFRDVFCYCYDAPMSGEEFFTEVRKQLGLPEHYRYIQTPKWVAYPARFILDLKQRMTGRTTIVNPDKIAELAVVYWLFSNNKLKQILGIETIKNDRAVAETVQWYQEHHLL
jgi:nucleoside-diphosphate-sugar epimerase